MTVDTFPVVPLLEGFNREAVTDAIRRKRRFIIPARNKLSTVWTKDFYRQPVRQQPGRNTMNASHCNNTTSDNSLEFDER